jgi:hypothetical protein
LLNEPAFDRLVAARLVHTFGHEFLFAHALIHEAVYDSLLKSRRRELHVRAADWFAPRDASLKASHLDRAGDAAAAAAYLEAAQGQRQEYRFDAGRKLAARGLEPIKRTSSLSTASSARSSSISGTCQRHWRRS